MEEKISLVSSCTGVYRDIITYADGTVETTDDHNLIVNDILKLIACLMKNQEGYKGIGYWAIGSGNPSWDSSPGSATVNDTRLENEIFRKAILPENFSFVDEMGRDTQTVTNKIRIKCTFLSTEAVGSWREFALFGGNANGSANTGVMVNHKVHGRLDKDNATSVERQIIFTFK